MSLTQINKAGLDEIALDHVFTVGASGTDHYTFQGEGLNGTVNDPTLYLTRGKTYRFEKGSAHPLRIQSTQGASGTAYNTGVTNNGGTGTVIIEVQHDAPDVLYYQCTSHAAMNGVLYITGALADGGVTTAKLANGAVTSTKLSGDIAANKLEVNDAHIIIGDNSNDGALQTLSGDVTMTRTGAVTIANDAVTAAKLANDAVISSNIVNGAVDSDKIADATIGLDKLVHGTSSNDGKFLRANNGADPTFETVDLTSAFNKGGGDTITGDFTIASGTTNKNINVDVSDKIKFDDNLKATFGDSDDLQIYHDGTNSYISEIGTGELRITADSGVHIRKHNNENIAKFTANGNVELYHDNSKKFQTESYGLQVFGNLFIADGGSGSGENRIDIGNGSDLKIYHDASNSKITNSSGRLHLENSGGNIRTQTNHGFFIMSADGNTTHAEIDNEGLKFNGDTAGANALNDYEEGTWTPKIKVYSNNTWVDASMDNNGTLAAAKYTKIGGMVHIYLNWHGWDIGSVNYCVMGNLPYTSAGTGGGGWGGITYSNAFNTNNFNAVYIGASSTLLEFYCNGNNWNGWSTSNNRYINLGLTYMTDQ